MSERLPAVPTPLLDETDSGRWNTFRQVIETISGELELRPLLTLIVRYACELLRAERGTIGLVDEVCNVVRTEAVYHMPPDELGSEMAPGVGLAGQVYLTRQPVVLNRYGDLDQPTQAGLIRDAVIGLPIFWHGRMIGFFGIGAEPPRSFTDGDIELLSLFARHAAIAIENARLFANMENALAEKQLLYETSQRISTALDEDEVIAAYLQQVAARGRYACTIVLYEFDELGERTAVLVRGRWAPGEGLRLLAERLPYSRDSLDPLLDAGQTVASGNVHEDERIPAGLRQMQTESKRPALVLIPLMVRNQRIGLVVLSYSSVHQWPESALQPYQATAAQLATAIDSRRQQLLVYESGRQIAVLEERQRLARDLHDSVTQLIFSTTLIAQSIAPAWRRDPAEGEKRVSRLLELSQAALSEMRALLFELRPAEEESSHNGQERQLPGILLVEQAGLVVALRRQAAELARDGLALQLEVASYQRQRVEAEKALYRIAQEALNNVVKHAQVHRVNLWLRSGDGEIEMTIGDDGRGFVTVATEDSGRFGLGNMRQRAVELGGTVTIVSAPGQGTRVVVRLPAAGTAGREGKGESGIAAPAASLLR
jgi:signal transduction histidine kinase